MANEMMAYKATMFMVFFNYAVIAANYISTLIFPDAPVQVQTANIPILGSVAAFTGESIVTTITTLMMSAGVLALFAFSLLIPTVPFVFMFFGLSAIVTNVYISQFSNFIPMEFLIPVHLGVTFTYYLGISQYAARSSFTGS